jgi:hypothetical protein
MVRMAAMLRQKAQATVGAAWRAIDARDVLLILGLVLIYAGLLAVDPWAPGASRYVPGLLLVAIAVFGVRGGGGRT